MTTKTRREFETLASAAERTGLSIRTLRRRIASGDLAAYRSGARVDPSRPERRRPNDGAHPNSLELTLAQAGSADQSHCSQSRYSDLDRQPCWAPWSHDID